VTVNYLLTLIPKNRKNPKFDYLLTLIPKNRKNPKNPTKSDNLTQRTLISLITLLTVITIIIQITIITPTNCNSEWCREMSRWQRGSYTGVPSGWDPKLYLMALMTLITLTHLTTLITLEP
jgi:hypothetical protein